MQGRQSQRKGSLAFANGRTYAEVFENDKPTWTGNYTYSRVVANSLGACIVPHAHAPMTP
jgi:hypothetical protein